MSIFNLGAPVVQLVAALLIGILVGSGATVLAANGGLFSLDGSLKPTLQALGDKLDTVLEDSSEVDKNLQRVKDEVSNISKTLDENTINAQGEYIKYLREILEAIENEVFTIETKLDNNKIDVNGTFLSYIQSELDNLSMKLVEIQTALENNDINSTGDLIFFLEDILISIENEVYRIEEKLDKNGIDVNGTFSKNLFNQLSKIENLLKNLNVTNISQNITNVNQSITNVFKTVKNIQSTVEIINETTINILDRSIRIYEFVEQIDISVKEIYNILIVDIWEQLTLIETSIQSIYSLTVNVYDILVIVENVLGDVYNIVVNIETRILQMIDMLVVIDYKTQKEVIIEFEHVSDIPDPFIKTYYVMVSLEGEGGLNSTQIVDIFVLDMPDAVVLVEETSVVGLYRVIVLLPDTTPPGTYILVVESEITLDLPDGSQEVFRGRQITSIFVW